MIVYLITQLFCSFVWFYVFQIAIEKWCYFYHRNVFAYTLSNELAEIRLSCSSFYTFVANILFIWINDFRTVRHIFPILFCLYYVSVFIRYLFLLGIWCIKTEKKNVQISGVQFFSEFIFLNIASWRLILFCFFITYSRDSLCFLIKYIQYVWSYMCYHLLASDCFFSLRLNCLYSMLNSFSIYIFFIIFV